MDVIVTSAMVDRGADVGGTLPPVYGAVAVAAHVAELSRRLVAPHLEPGEVAVTTRLEAIVRDPVPVGATVRLDATVQVVSSTRVTCEVLVRHRGAVAVRGSCEQEVVPALARRDRIEGARG